MDRVEVIEPTYLAASRLPVIRITLLQALSDRRSASDEAPFAVYLFSGNGEAFVHSFWKHKGQGGRFRVAGLEEDESECEDGGDKHL